MPSLPGSEVVVAGAYNVSYASTSVGMMKGDDGVPTLSQISKAKPVDNTDRYGQSTVTAFTGGADWFAQFICMEYKAGSLAAWWPFGALGVMGIIGRDYTDLAAALVLTAVTGTPAATSPATLTASKTILAPGYNTQLLFGPFAREVPIRLQLLPYLTAGSTVGWFTQT